MRAHGLLDVGDPNCRTERYVRKRIKRAADAALRWWVTTVQHLTRRSSQEFACPQLEV
jgi:hypothetical protein